MRKREIAARAESLANEIVKERPSDTLANVYDLPTIRAVIEMNRNNPGKAIETLEPVIPYDLANLERGLSSVYERGQAYLLLHKGSEAAAEFQKFWIILVSVHCHHRRAGTFAVGAGLRDRGR